MEKIFISWSGKKSKEMGVVLKRWLENIFSDNDTHVSNKKITWMSVEIGVGEPWFSSVNDALDNSAAIILCITKENQNSPWLLFESGRVYRQQANSRVLPFLVDMNQLPVKSPLHSLQYFSHLPNDVYESKEDENKENAKKLIITLNSLLDKSLQLEERDLMVNFNNSWDSFYTEYQEIRSRNPLSNLDYEFRFSDLMSNLSKKYKSDFYINADKNLLNMLFYDEYQDIGEDDLGTRIQYIVDRSTLFVYLESSEYWLQEVNNLRRSRFLDKEDVHFDKIMCTLQILSRVFEYHIFMGNKNKERMEETPEEITIRLTELKDKVNQTVLEKLNPMVRCLFYDYLGLAFHKRACRAINESLGRESFYDAFKTGLDDLKDTKTSFEKGKEFLEEAIQCFSKVIEICEPKQVCYDPHYIWLSFAEFNKARCFYLLSAWDTTQEEKYDKTMRSAIRNRKEDYLHRYDNLPVAIKNSLWSEYLHAYLEYCSYQNKPADLAIKNSFKRWREGLEKKVYSDVLNLQRKIEHLDGTTIKKDSIDRIQVNDETYELVAKDEGYLFFKKSQD